MLDLIDQDTARTRREEVRQEADFYGAMDGASPSLFVVMLLPVC